MFAIPSTIIFAFDVRVLAASAAASALCRNGKSSVIPFHSPDANFGSIYFSLRTPKDTPPISHAAYVAAVFGLDLFTKSRKNKVQNKILEQE